MAKLEVVPDSEVKHASQEEVDATVYTQASVRVLLTWTPVKIQSAESSSNNGDLSFAAELCDNLLADERIGGAIETRTGGLLGLPVAFQDGRGDESGESPLAPELTEDWSRSYPETELKQLEGWGIILGVGFAQQVWAINEDGRFAPSIKTWHPKHFRWLHHLQRWSVRTEDEGDVIIEPDDPKWIVYTPYGQDRPWARGLWRGLSRWWMLKWYAISDWGLHGEQASRLVITSGLDSRIPSPTKEQREAMSNDLQSLGKDGVIALPNGFDVDLLEAKANTENLFGAQVKAANDGITIAINGQTLTTSVEGGSRSAAEVHERVEARRLRSDGVSLSSIIRAQSLIWWTLWNFGKNAVAPWPTWETDPPEDLENKAVVFNTMAEALVKFKTAGLQVKDLDQMSQDYGIPELEKRDEPETEGDDVEDGAPGDDDPNSDGSDPDDPDPTVDSGTGDEPQARAHTGPRLASGDDITMAGGFKDGDAYAVSLANHGKRLQALDNRETGLIERLAEALNQEDYAAIEVAVLELYEAEASPEAMSTMIEHLFIMAQRAGEVAVDQDA